MTTAPVSTGVGTARTRRIAAVVDRVAAALDGDPGPTGPAVSLEGGAGVALLLAELARRDPARLPAAHGRLAAAAEALKGTASFGGQHGPAAVLTAVQAAAKVGGHYPGLRRTLTAHVAAEQLGRLAATEGTGPGVTWADYDVITGAAGVGRVLLGAVTDGDAEERAAAEPALRATLTRLVGISRPVRVDGRQAPGWWVPAHRQVTEADRTRFPRGALDLGTAHGIAGPLALLARSAELGVTVAGQSAALRRIGDWLAERADRDAYGPYWEPRLPLDDEWARARGGRTPPAPPRTAGAGAAWCYGTVGIANSLLRAAGVTGEQDWARLALAGAHGVSARPGSLDALRGPTVCHGEAGFLQTLWRLGRQSADPALLARCDALADRLAGAWDERSRYGYRHLSGPRGAAGPQYGRPPVEDNPGIFEGAAGVAAALLSTLPHPAGTDGEAHEPVWDRVLLLS
ncbi:lanthionine synthetase C family protein [Streptacidiphilus rugosus]|uniref:lanthionine synthetase C family protein n=1 Tax=Streptacidiphilus rugosus TaxID=405783 RepID=UPI00068F3908|nr:lanthionine synthetase C family protein [Streptacidiphilus rugosus]